MQKKAIVLLSGGLDSTTCLAIAQSQGYDCYALSFNYGQTLVYELEAAKKIARAFHVTQHKVIALPALGELGGSALTDEKIPILDYQGDQCIPNTYVPARNTIFLSMALAWAEVIQAFDVFLGANVVDYSGYPDCRPDYLRAFEAMANLATCAGVSGKRFSIHAPLLQWTKGQIIAAGLRLGVDYSMTVSCYRVDREGRSCGKCDSCMHRKKGFLEVGLDPR